MAGIFNPQLGGSAAAFSPPVNQPSGVSAIAGLVSGFVSTIPSKDSGTKTKSGDEFDARWRAAQSLDQWTTKLDPNNPNVTKNTNEFANWYVRQFPQDATKVNSLVTGIESRLDPLEQDKIAYLKTAEGQVADVNARSRATDPTTGVTDQAAYNALILKSQAVNLSERARQEAVTRQASIGGSEATISDNRWSASSPKFQQDTADVVASLQGIASDLQDSDSVQLTETQMAGLLAAGVQMESNVITRNNARIVLSQIKRNMSNNFRNNLNARFPGIQAAPESVMAQITSPLDSLIDIIKADFSNATAVMNATLAITGQEVFSNLGPELQALIALKAQVPSSTALDVKIQELGTEILTSVQTMNTKKMTTTDVSSSITKGSTDQAETTVALNVERLKDKTNLEEGDVSRSILNMILGTAKSRPDAIFATSMWSEFQHPEFLNAVETDPQYVKEINGRLAADLNRTLRQAQGELGATALVSVEADGTLTFTFPETGTQEGSTPFDRLVGGASGEQFRKLDEPARAEREKAAIDNANKVFKDFNMKVNTLKTLGDFGSNIIDAVTTQDGSSSLEGGTGADVLLPSLSEQGISSGFGLIKSKEGFRESAYWDVDHWRVGYGSDSITKADGTVVEVTEQTTTTRADADRDLERRYSIFQAGASRKIGTDTFNAFPEDTKQALTSIAYNYGSIPDRLIAAARSGDLNALAKAVEGLGNDNSGINRQRRFEEASLIRGAGNTLTAGGSLSFPAPKNRADADLSGSQTALNVPSAASSTPQATTPAQSTSEAPVTVSVSTKKIPQATLDQINSRGLSTDEIFVFDSEKEAQEAFTSGILTVGDHVVVDGRLQSLKFTPTEETKE